MKMKLIANCFQLYFVKPQEMFWILFRDLNRIPEILQSDLIKFLDQVLFAKKWLIAKK